MSTNKQKAITPCLTIHYVADHSGCGAIRTIFPNDILNSTYGQSKKYEGIVSSRFFIDQNLLANAKVIRFQRQITNDQLKFIELIRQIRDKNNLPYKIIYDVDDLYTNVPNYNAASKFYNQPFIKENVSKVVNLVDIFTVTTYELKKEIETFKGTCKVKVIPNYVPKYIYRPTKEIIKKENNKPTVLWAGSATHFSLHDQGDFSLILDLIKNTTKEFDWLIMGISKDHIPYWFKDIAPKVKIINWMRSIQSFPSFLKELNADFGLAPLLNNPFNKCKSNIKCLDYASADILSICSNIVTYKDDSKVFLQDDWKEDRDQIIDIFQNKQKKEEIINKQNKMLDKYYLETKGISKYKELFGF